MKMIELGLTEREAEIFDQVTERIDATAAFLAGLPYEERINWLKEHQYCRSISFEREIGGTVYTVSTHFSGKTAETVEGKVERILSRNIAQ